MMTRLRGAIVCHQHEDLKLNSKHKSFHIASLPTCLCLRCTVQISCISAALSREPPPHAALGPNPNKSGARLSLVGSISLRSGPRICSTRTTQHRGPRFRFATRSRAARHIFGFHTLQGVELSCPVCPELDHKYRGRGRDCRVTAGKWRLLTSAGPKNGRESGCKNWVSSSEVDKTRIVHLGHT